MDNLPPPIKVTQGANAGNSKLDDPIFEAKINNPFSNFFNWLKNFIKRNQNITIKIPIIGVLVALSSFSLGLGSGYNWGFNAAAAKFFPNSSPVLHRSISLEGTVQKSDQQKYYLKSEDNLWTLKAAKPNVNLADYLNKQVQVLGNLTKEANVVEVSEVIPLESNPAPSLGDESTSGAGPNLPTLYSGLTWEVTQSKILTFTSGKRRIEQEGVYLESSQVNTIPQEFTNYYIAQLTNSGFKQTLNSSEPNGTTITYAKDDLFLTFGVKNIYSGSGDNKKLIGYKAFIEHN